MESKERKITVDKVLIVAVVVGMFAFAAAGSILSPKNNTDICKVASNNLSQNCMYINR